MPLLITSLLAMKCPVCREGSVFKNPNPYKLKTIGDMHDVCTVCGQNFRPEPGFYFGGAVVSYTLMVIFNVAVVVLFYLIAGDIFNHVFSLLFTLAVASVLVAPAMFRYSRIVWLYINFRFRGKT